jgi:starvation-inducible DNA-binding protein
MVAAASKLPEYPVDAKDGRVHVEALATALATFGASVRAAIEESAKLGDADTSDLFTGISRGADKRTWFLEAHLQAER